MKKDKRIEYTCIYNNFATQFVQLILDCGMLWLWNQGDRVKQPRPTDTYNTLINRHCMGGGVVFLRSQPRVFPTQGSPREEEGGCVCVCGGGAGLLIN